jgi:hypothetical protein
MRKAKFIAVAFVVSLLCTSASWAVPTVDLQEWGFNINGYHYDNVVYGDDPSVLPGNFNTSGFDFGTGLGTISVSFSAPGNYALAAFFDHEMNQFVNGWMDELSAQAGTRPAGLSFQSETPNDVRDRWFWPFDYGVPLQNAVEFGPAEDGSGLPGGAQTANDISMAIGWNFILDPGEIGMVTFDVTRIAPTGFYLEQKDIGFTGFPGADPGSIYFTSVLNIRTSSVPEPSTMLLLAAGLVSIIMGKRHMFK